MNFAGLSPPGLVGRGESEATIKADGMRIDVMVFSSRLTYEGDPAMLGAVVDVTERNRAEAKVRTAQEFLDTIVENIPVSILVKNAGDFRYALANRAYEELLGISREAVLGKTPAEVFSEQVAKAIARNDQEALANPGAPRSDEVVFQTPRGTRRVKRRRVLVPRTAQIHRGRARGRNRPQGSGSPHSHLQEHDLFTDLPFGGVFRQQLEADIEQARNKGSTLAILRLDLDHFKDADDAFGEACGDAVLREVADRLRSAAAGTYLARGGGDEFTLISGTAADERGSTGPADSARDQPQDQSRRRADPHRREHRHRGVSSRRRAMRPR